MRPILYPDPREFLIKCEDWLASQGARNDLILGVLQGLGERSSSAQDGLYLAAVHEGSRPVAAAMMTIPNKVVLAGDENAGDDALVSFIQDLQAWPTPAPGVNGPDFLSQRFARLWRQTTGEREAVTRRMGVYALYRLHPPRPVSGHLRPAETGDLGVVLVWARAFQEEALGQQLDSGAESRLEQAVAAGHIYLWADPEPVSMAAQARPTRHSMTVNLVYTPPELRGRGYASNAVAAVSQHILSQGYRYATLFTDMANPTSNHIYQDIGYEWVCAFEEFEFRK